jgi:hypothetical protein
MALPGGSQAQGPFSRGFGTHGGGADDRVATPAVALGSSDDISLFLWLRLQPAQQNGFAHLFAWDDGLTRHVFVQRGNAADVMRFNRASSDTLYRGDFAFPMDDAPHSLLITWSGATFEVAAFVDGEAVAVGLVQGSGTPTAATAPLVWGNRASGLSVIDGRCQDCAVWRRVLAPSDARFLHRGGDPAVVAPSGPIALYRMNASDQDEVLGPVTIVGTTLRPPLRGQGGRPDVPLPAELPGLVGWVSTQRSGWGAPAHGDPVAEARDALSGSVLFARDGGNPTPRWDSQTFDIPALGSDGSGYLTREPALPVPGLLLVAVALAPEATDFQKISGARSTQTPGGDSQEAAWVLQRTAAATAQMRGVVATDGSINHTAVPNVLGEKILVMMEVDDSPPVLRVWQAGAQEEITVAGTPITADAQQALLAGYYANVVAKIMHGHLFEFLQYAQVPSRQQRRALVGYVQELVWPGVRPPVAATVSAGRIKQGSAGSVDVVAPSSGSALVLASIDEPPAVGEASISGNRVTITVPAGAPLGRFQARYCLRSDVVGARLVDFGRVDFEVVAGTAGGGPPPARMAFWHAYMGGRNTAIWNLRAPELTTHVDTWDNQESLRVWRSKGVKILHNIKRSGRDKKELARFGTDVAAIRDYLLSARTQHGFDWDGVIVDEMSPAPQNVDNCTAVMDALGQCRATDPSKIWAVFHTPNTPGQWFWDRVANVDRICYEAYQCCGSAGLQSECEPSVANIVHKCGLFRAQGAAVVRKTIFLISLAWPGQGSCDIRPSPAYFRLQIAKIKELCPDAAGIGTASGTGGAIGGIAYNDYDPIVRSVYGGLF